MNTLNKRTVLSIKIALLSAIAVLLMYLEFPVLPAFNWLKIDLSDIPALIGAFAFGPLAGILIEGLKNVLIILVKGTDSGGVGQIANFIIGASFVGVAGLIYVRSKTFKTAVISMIAATIFMSIVGVLANYYILIPLYKMDQMPQSWLMNYILTGVIPFNLIKGVLVSAVTLIIYKRVAIIIKAEGFRPSSNSDTKKIA